MQSRALHRILASLLVASFSIPAIAQYTRDASATKKIDEAVNTHYLMMELDKAEDVLTGTVKACEDKCRPATVAKAWMYVGIVRGSGRSDQAGAAEAFTTAKGLDPAVELDSALATPETKTTFDGIAGGAAPVAVAAAPVAAAPPEEVPGDMVCTPEVRDIQTRMPLPISCSSDVGAESAILKFKEFGSDQWKKIDMKKVGELFQAEIPCDVTGTAGAFSFYVGAKDAAGEYVDQYGSKKQPGTINLSDNAAGPAPSFPGGQPVARCADSSDCPPDFPGCGGGEQTCGELDWGASCDNSSQCKCGLACEDGACASAPACTTDGDCSEGSCVKGYCSAGAEAEKGPSGPFKRHWLSVDAGADLTFLGGTNLCTVQQANDYGSYCYGDDNGIRYLTEFDAAGRQFSVGSGPALTQIRVRLGYDFAFTEHMLAGVRVGMGFVNTPPGNASEITFPDGSQTQGPGSFLPVSAEARFTYNFTSLADAGLRPTLYAGGGIMDSSAAIPGIAPLEGVTLYKRSGIVAVGGGGSIGYAFAPHMNLKFELGVQALLGSFPVNVALSPSLGFQYGL